MSPIRRKYLDGYPVFIAQVTLRRRPIFADPAEAVRALDVLRNVQRLHPFKMHAWVIIPDHLHLLIRPGPGETHSRIMHAFKTALAAQYKSSRGLTQATRICQKRYFDTVITFEAAYLARIDHIHHNPVKHGLCDSPHDWRFSSIHTCRPHPTGLRRAPTRPRSGCR